jgi:hypothetical protein
MSEHLMPELSRPELERVIEALITMLDDIDPDSDLEDNGDYETNGDDEPSLGSLDQQRQDRWAAGSNPANGYDIDLELDTADDEPSLGSTGCLGFDNQMNSWGGPCSGTTDDRERTGYACETEDEEPSLGWGADVNQAGLTQGYIVDGTEREPSLGRTEMQSRFGRYGWLGCSDLEEQCEDEGAEHDGREPDHDDEPDYRWRLPPKGYMHPSDVGFVNGFAGGPRKV